MKKYLQTGIVVVIFLFICSIALPTYAAEPEKRIVKVAYYDMGNYYTETSDGNVESYDTEMLDKIERYSNIKFEYVNCGTWANALKLLNEHKVELVGTMQWTRERGEQYEFCQDNYGYTVAELVGLASKNYVYEDYDAIGKATIGCTKDYVRMDEMNELLSEHNISPKIKTYAGQTELEEALEAGEIDLIAANSHTLKPEWKVVEKFFYAPFYLVSWKGNEELTKQINDAIIAINLSEPDSDDELLQKFFPSIMGAPLTKAECDLIAKNKVYTIYYDPAVKPLAWYDKDSDSMKGALVEACGQISKNTGLRINIRPIREAPKVPSATTIKYTTLFVGTNEDLSGTTGVTNALIDENFNLFYQKDHAVDLGEEKYTIAVVKNRNLIKEYIKERFPKSTVCECDTPQECLDKVEKGSVDLAYLNIRVAGNAIIESGIVDIKEYPIEATNMGIGMQFTGVDSELLASIVNKGITLMDKNVITKSFVQYALETHEPVTFGTLLRNHLSWVFIGIGVFILLLLCIAVLFTYACVMKKQKDRIAEADEDKSEFFSRMSHDMRTPMNGILGMIQLSEDTDDVKQIHDNLHKAKSAGRYMLSLINDTLDLQRIESKKIQMEKDVVNVEDYYNGIFSILKISAEQKQLDFIVKYIDIDKKNYIELDTVRMKQILSNLISNAIKFTPENGAVMVTVESLGQEKNILHRKYQVKDTGVGMSEDFIKNHLYMPYSQENNAFSSQLTGSGLGMAITKNLVELMGGCLEVESTLGEGTTFTVYLDIKRASNDDVEKLRKKKAAEEETIIEDLSGKRILLCEDHPLNAEITIRLLEKIGCEVKWAENGQIGVEFFEQSEENYYDAVLMDIRMPVMDGLEAAKAIRSLNNGDAATVPIIAMTANAYESDVKNCLNAGMNTHLAKPVNPKQLYKTLFDQINAEL